MNKKLMDLLIETYLNENNEEFDRELMVGKLRSYIFGIKNDVENILDRYEDGIDNLSDEQLNLIYNSVVNCWSAIGNISNSHFD